VLRLRKSGAHPRPSTSSARSPSPSREDLRRLITAARNAPLRPASAAGPAVTAEELRARAGRRRTRRARATQDHTPPTARSAGVEPRALGFPAARSAQARRVRPPAEASGLIDRSPTTSCARRPAELAANGTARLTRASRSISPRRRVHRQDLRRPSCRSPTGSASNRSRSPRVTDPAAAARGPVGAGAAQAPRIACPSTISAPATRRCNSSSSRIAARTQHAIFSMAAELAGSASNSAQVYVVWWARSGGRTAANDPSGRGRHPAELLQSRRRSSWTNSVTQYSQGVASGTVLLQRRRPGRRQPANQLAGTGATMARPRPAARRSRSSPARRSGPPQHFGKQTKSAREPTPAWPSTSSPRQRKNHGGAPLQ